MTDEIKRHALDAYIAGAGYATAAQLAGTTSQRVRNWVKEEGLIAHTPHDNGKAPRDIRARILDSIKVDANECWLWIGRIKEDGYVDVLIGSRRDGSRRKAKAHRVSYETFIGPIPVGMTLDHLCHTRDSNCRGGRTCAHRRCVNPTHLEPCSIGENAARSGNVLTTINAAKTHCLKCRGGLTMRENGTRYCRPCLLAYYREYNHARNSRKVGTR